MAENFYDTWLKFWDQATEEKRKARKVIHEEEAQWMRTHQDYRAALLCAPETGFRTWGTSSMVAEIPPSWHTGKHAHGEEGMFILEGEGFTTVKLAQEEGSGKRFNWSKHSTVWIPFGAEHQHFNTGNTMVRYYSLMTLHLEHWLGMGKLDQLEEAGETRTLPQLPVAQTGFDDKGRRVVLLANEIMWPDRGEGDFIRHSKIAPLMTRDLGFQNAELEISSIFYDEHTRPHGIIHAHMEAILYVFQGEGYTTVDDERLDWKRGTCFHVQGPQTKHIHFCTSQEPAQMLRCAPGVRMDFAHRFALERFPYLVWNDRGELIRSEVTHRGLGG